MCREVKSISGYLTDRYCVQNFEHQDGLPSKVRKRKQTKGKYAIDRRLVRVEVSVRRRE